MAQTTVSIRMDEGLKKELEWLCSELGMNITTAMTVFAKTAVRERRIPFDLALTPLSMPKAIEDMTIEELDKKLQAGLDDISAGRVRPAKEAFQDLRKKYNK